MPANARQLLIGWTFLLIYEWNTIKIEPEPAALSKMSLREFLDGDQPIVMDGSLVTSLYDSGFYINRSFEELSILEADAVRKVIAAFKQAGARLLSTNTFGATLPKLTEYGLQDRLAEIIGASTELTKEIAGDDAYTLATLGPLGVVLEPLGPTSTDEARDAYKLNVKAFEQHDVDGYLLLGFHDLKELECAIEAIEECSDKPVFPHVGIQESMKTSYGHSLKEYAERIEKYKNVVCLGLSGEVGPSGMLSALGRLQPFAGKPISLRPNAGLPRYVNDQYIYLCNPDYIGKYSKRFVQAGARLVGGHSGVSDQHIRAISNALRMTANLEAKFEITNPSIRITNGDKPKEIKAARERSRLGKYLANGTRIFTVEINPPRGVDCKKFFNQCKALDDGGVEFVNIPDGARAMSRMSSLHVAAYLQNNFGLEPIPHFTTRDRNLLGLQSDLLGAHVNGVRNILAVTGDPPKLGNCPGASGVYDVDAIGLTHIASRMNQGLDLGGSSFGKPTEFLLGVALNPTARNQELEIQRFKYKIEAGADYAITQPIYDLEAYQKFMDKLGNIRIPVIMGIWPLVSLRNAEFLKNEVPGVEVPDWAIHEMEKANSDKEESLKRGMDIAMKTMDQAKKMVAGFQVSAPFNKVDISLDVIHAIQD